MDKLRSLPKNFTVPPMGPYRELIFLLYELGLARPSVIARLLKELVTVYGYLKVIDDKQITSDYITIRREGYRAIIQELDDFWFSPDVFLRLQQDLKEATSVKSKSAVSNSIFQENLGLYYQLAAGGFNLLRTLAQRIPALGGTRHDKVPQIVAIVNINRHKPVIVLGSHLEGPYMIFVNENSIHLQKSIRRTTWGLTSVAYAN